MSIIRIIVSIAIASFLMGCESDSTTSSREISPPSVTTAIAEKRSIPNEAAFVGRVLAKNRVEVRSQVSGLLVKQAYKEGKEVAKGDLLFLIQPDEYEIALESARAQVASAEVERDQADQYLKRLESVKTGGVSPTDLDTARFTMSTAKAVVDQAKALQKTAQLNLDRTSIYAPIDGLAGKAVVSAGNLVDSSTGVLATIVQLDPIRVQYSLTERFTTEILQSHVGRDPNLPPVRDALISRIILSNGYPYPLEGKIVYLDNEISLTTGTTLVEAEFSNPDRMLLPGQFVDVIVQRGPPIEKLTIPQSAVQQDQQGKFVLTVSTAGEVSKRRVEMGDRYETNWEVLSGLLEGECVITQGIEKVRPGVKVGILPVDTGLKNIKTSGTAL